MDYNISYLTILLFFIPGLILSKLDLFYGADRRANYLNQFYNVLIAGAVTYGFVGLGYWHFEKDFSIPFEVLLGFPEAAVETTREYMGFALSADNPLYHWIDGKEVVSVKVVTLVDCIDEVAWAVGISYVLSIVWLKGVKHKILARSLRWLNVTDRFSEYDLWTEYINVKFLQKVISNEDLNKLPNVRIWKYDKKFVYNGKILALSDFDSIREVVLLNVEIFRFDENLKIHGPPRKQSFVYLSFSKDDVWMEFPKEGEKKWHV